MPSKMTGAADYIVCPPRACYSAALFGFHLRTQRSPLHVVDMVTILLWRSPFQERAFPIFRMPLPVIGATFFPVRHALLRSLGREQEGGFAACSRQS
jgi:hypothetical protein